MGRRIIASPNQCLVFDLPGAAGGMAAGIHTSMILKKLKKFSDTYNVHYKTKFHRQQLKIWFDQDQDYTLFFLVYTTDKQWRRPYIIHEDYN